MSSVFLLGSSTTSGVRETASDIVPDDTTNVRNSPYQDTTGRLPIETLHCTPCKLQKPGPLAIRLGMMKLGHVQDIRRGAFAKLRGLRAMTRTTREPCSWQIHGCSFLLALVSRWPPMTELSLSLRSLHCVPLELGYRHLAELFLSP